MPSIEVRCVAERDIERFSLELSVGKMWAKQSLPMAIAEDTKTGEIIGYIAPRIVSSDGKTAILDGIYSCCIYVIPEYRSRGIGSMLLSLEEELLRKHGIEAIEVLLLYGINIVSQSHNCTHLLQNSIVRDNLYSKKNGWEVVGELKRDIRQEVSKLQIHSENSLKLVLSQSYGLPLDIIASVPWNESPEIYDVKLIKRKVLV